VRDFPAPAFTTTHPEYGFPRSSTIHLFTSLFLDRSADRFYCHHPPIEMSKRKDSFTRLLPSTSMSRFGKEKGREPPIISAPIQLPRRRTSTVRVTSNDDSEQRSPTSRPSTPTSASAKLLRMTSKAGLRSLDTSSTSSLRSTSKAMPKPPGSPGQRKNSFRAKAPKPLKLDGKVLASPDQESPNSWEAATTSYEEQFRRRRGDPLHRLGPSVPYMQAYDRTSLQW